MSMWESYRSAQRLKRELRSLASITPGDFVLQRVREEVGERIEVKSLHRAKRRSLKVVALVVCLPFVTVVAGAATLYPQTSEGAQLWIAKLWSDQLARTDIGDGTTGLASSVIGVTGFDHPSKLTWSQYGLARLSLRDMTNPDKPRLIVIGSSMKMTSDVKTKLACLLSPAIAKELESFQETHAANPITKITLEGKTEEFRGFGHFEIKNEAGKVIIVADVTPIKN